MSEAKAIDTSKIRFSSTAFPSEEDMRLWRSLTPAEQRAVVLRDIEEGLRGPAAVRASKDEILAEVLAELGHAG